MFSKDSTNDLIIGGFLKSGEALKHSIHIINFLCQMECAMFDVDEEMPTPVEADYKIGQAEEDEDDMTEVSSSEEDEEMGLSSSEEDEDMSSELGSEDEGMPELSDSEDEAEIDYSDPEAVVEV